MSELGNPSTALLLRSGNIFKIVPELVEGLPCRRGSGNIKFKTGPFSPVEQFTAPGRRSCSVRRESRRVFLRVSTRRWCRVNPLRFRVRMR